MDEEEIPQTFDPAAAQDKRGIAFRILGVVVLVLAILGGGYYFIIASKHVTTDDAYVAAEIAQIAPATSGIIKEIAVTDTDKVKAGDVLVVIDDTDAKLALDKAEADYAKASAEADRTKTDYNRRAALIKSGSVSQEEVTTTSNAYKSAQATMNAAKATLDQAKVDLDRTIIKSPIDGTVARRQVQLGQRVQVGSPLMSVVPHDVHVDANFKEVQLRKVKVGQPAELTSDVYGSSVVYHGKVEGFSGGTGSAFALIPAQNATGNWIKVVQRLPVRIELDPAELTAHPLEVGLSVDVDIDISGGAK